MKRVGIVYLITENPKARGVLDTPTETRRKTYCEEKSLSMSEVYQARASGFLPVIRLVLPQDFEYRGETLCEYKGERYEIIRDYRDEKTGDSTELTIQRVRGNASTETPTAPDPEQAAPAGESGPAEETEPTQGEPAVTGDTAANEPAAEGNGDGQ